MQATQIQMPAVGEFPRVTTAALPAPGPPSASWRSATRFTAARTVSARSLVRVSNIS